MSLINPANMQLQCVQNFAFSSARPDSLGATEYTLATIVLDITGSVAPVASELKKMKQTVLEACQKNPRSAYLMLRSVQFQSSVHEEHGFCELGKLNAQMYQTPVCDGSTALYDATFNALKATNEYAKILSDQDFSVNGVVFIITDGDDNVSRTSLAEVAKENKRAVQGEWLESLNTILIGINAGYYKPRLEEFQQKAGLTQYVDVADATSKELAKLAAFVSQSISSQSQALGTGGASVPLTF